jgi:excisionase family DNA binding protein
MLTIDEAAAFAGVGRRAIDAAIKAGNLTAHRGLGQGRRVKRADLERWVGEL